MRLDFLFLIQFYIAFIVLGIAVLPLAVKLFSNFKFTDIFSNKNNKLNP